MPKPVAVAPSVPRPVFTPAPRPAAVAPAPAPSPTVTAPPKPAPRPPQQSGPAGLLAGTIARNAEGGGGLTTTPANSQTPNNRQASAPARQDVDLGPYLAALRRRVQREWNPNSPNNNRQTVVGFSIARNGQISNLQVIRTSGSSITDQETLSAVQRAAPFAPLPEQYPHPQLNIEFTFNIFVSGGQNSQIRGGWYGF
ncbi:MAG: TonB C-terminal domain-containing protein [Gloeomargaritaceae cyanobacterium C42_A2020_066]|nr:TonB C-terminal domain-containing protein [Gloeomargaritaceae cyanobacterium C42_A2020_066]